jgi:hypothetical protein
MQRLFGLNADSIILMSGPPFVSGENKKLTFETLLYYATVIKRDPPIQIAYYQYNRGSSLSRTVLCVAHAKQGVSNYSTVHPQFVN